MRTDLQTRLMANVLLNADETKLVFRRNPSNRVTLASGLVGLFIFLLFLTVLRGFYPF